MSACMSGICGSGVLSEVCLSRFDVVNCLLK